jgi:hypothetical protein
MTQTSSLILSTNQMRPKSQLKAMVMKNPTKTLPHMHMSNIFPIDLVKMITWESSISSISFTSRKFRIRGTKLWAMRYSRILILLRIMADLWILIETMGSRTLITAKLQWDISNRQLPFRICKTFSKEKVMRLSVSDATQATRVWCSLKSTKNIKNIEI